MIFMHRIELFRPRHKQTNKPPTNIVIHSLTNKIAMATSASYYPPEDVSDSLNAKGKRPPTALIKHHDQV